MVGIMANNFTLYHNPRCSKSRQTLALLQENGIEPEIVLYLETQPGEAELRKLLKKLGITARELIRKGEESYKSLKLANTELDERALIQAMAKDARLIERPIVVAGNKAVLGRPPENALDLL